MRKRKWMTLICLASMMTAGCAKKEKDLGLNLKKEGESFEYALKTVNPLDYAYSDAEAEISCDVSEIDLSVPGEYEVSFTAETRKYFQEIKCIITVADTAAPVIEFIRTETELKIGDEFEPAGVISKIYDPVDGDLIKCDSRPEENTGWYYIKSDVNTDKAGEYTVIVTATDCHDNVTESQYKVTVKEEETESDESKSSSGSADSVNASSGKQSSTSGASGNTYSKPASSNTSSGSSSSSSGSGSSSSSAGTGSTSGSSSGSGNSTPAHTHSWQPVYQTAHHDAVYENRWVVDQYAYDETLYGDWYDITYCNLCGFSAFGASQIDVICDHILMHDQAAGYHTESYRDVIGTKHHDETGHYESVQVSPGYDEDYLVGYKCSCGATQ